MKLYVVLLCLIITTSSWATEILSGKIVDLKGDAFLVDGGTRLKVGDLLKEGDKVSTGEKSRLRILLNTEAAIQLGPNSQFILKRSENGPVLIELIRGTVLSRIRPSAKNEKQERYKVKVNGVVLAVRGTSFFVGHEKMEKPIYVCFCQGTIDFHMKGVDRTLTSKHHDTEYWIDEKLDQIRTKGKSIPHTDKELEALNSYLIKH